MAVVCGLTAPICFSYKAVYFRVSIAQYKYDTSDLAIDGQLVEHAILTVFYLIYVAQNGFNLNELLIGSWSAMCFVVAGTTCAICFNIGPAGPVQSIFSTQLIYQVLLNSYFFGQTITLYQILGICTGTVGCFVISLDDHIKRLFC